MLIRFSYRFRDAFSVFERHHRQCITCRCLTQVYIAAKIRRQPVSKAHLPRRSCSSFSLCLSGRPPYRLSVVIFAGIAKSSDTVAFVQVYDYRDESRSRSHQEEVSEKYGLGVMIQPEIVYLPVVAASTNEHQGHASRDCVYPTQLFHRISEL